MPRPAGVPIPPEFMNRLGRMVRGDFYWIDVLLKDGTALKGLASNGKQILGAWDGQGAGDWSHAMPFNTTDIRIIRPHSWLPFWEQLFLSSHRNS